jgi:hypothetical protein
MKRSRIGQGLVELCLVLPFMLLFASALLDIGLLVFVNLQVYAANSEAIRVVSQNTRTEDQLLRIFDQELGLPIENRHFSVSSMLRDPALGNRPSATISVRYRHQWVSFFPWNSESGVVLTSVMSTPILTNAGTPGALVAD